MLSNDDDLKIELEKINSFKKVFNATWKLKLPVMTAKFELPPLKNGWLCTDKCAACIPLPVSYFQNPESWGSAHYFSMTLVNFIPCFFWRIFFLSLTIYPLLCVIAVVWSCFIMRKICKNTGFHRLYSPVLAQSTILPLHGGLRVSENRFLCKFYEGSVNKMIVYNPWG